jgi:hypothetical protein
MKFLENEAGDASLLLFQVLLLIMNRVHGEPISEVATWSVCSEQIWKLKDLRL